jgi:hypothetical protein
MRYQRTREERYMWDIIGLKVRWCRLTITKSIPIVVMGYTFPVQFMGIWKLRATRLKITKGMVFINRIRTEKTWFSRIMSLRTMKGRGCVLTVFMATS